MNSFSRIPQSFPLPTLAPAGRPSCAVCGSADVVLDEVVEAGIPLGLGECRHCEYRWTCVASPEPTSQLPPVIRQPLAA